MPCLGRILLADLTAQHVQAMFTFIARQHEAEGSPVTAATLARIRATLRAALNAAIRAGGTTLRDYVGTDGSPGSFRHKLYVYERDGRPCRVCRTPIRKIRQGQRSSYYCPRCQHS